MPKVESFERYANRYEEWFVKNRFAYEAELQAIRKLLPKSHIGVEIGVGTGRFAVPLGLKFGVEPSKAMGEIAQKRGIEVIDGVAEALPFKDSQFDFALMVTTICFIDDIETSFKEAHRVLKPKGFLIIGFVDRNSPLGMAYQKHKNENVFYKEANFYSTDEVVSYLKKAGFQDFAFTQTIFQDLKKISEIEPVREGYGEGSFVAVRGLKSKAAGMQISHSS